MNIQDFIEIYGETRTETMRSNIFKALKPEVIERLGPDAVTEVINQTENNLIVEGIIALQMEHNGSNPLCTRCGSCCKKSHPIGLTDDDISSLAKGLYESEERIIRKYTRPFKGKKAKYRIKKDKPCMFYDDGAKKCRVYHHRPEVCRIYPLTGIDEANKSAMWPKECDIVPRFFESILVFNVNIAYCKKFDPPAYAHYQKLAHAEIQSLNGLNFDSMSLLERIAVLHDHNTRYYSPRTQKGDH